MASEMTGAGEAATTSAQLVFQQLLGLAFDPGGSPTVVADATLLVKGQLSGLLAESWPRHILDANEDYAACVQEHLNRGPVLLLPPWGRVVGTAGREVSKPPVRWAHEAILLDCQPASSASELAVLLPASSLVSQSSRRFREALARQWQPTIVMFATGETIGVHPQVSIGALFLRPRQKEPGLIRVFKLPANPDASLVVRDFERLLARQGGRSEYGYVIRDALPPGESLAFVRHDPLVRRRADNLVGYGKLVRLGDLFEIYRSVGLSRPGTPAEEGAVRVLAVRDIGRNHTIAAPDDQSQWLTIPQDRRLKPGDLILRGIYHPTDLGGLVVAEVTAADLPAAGGNHVIVLRPKQYLDPPHRLALTLFLQTSLARTLVLLADGDPYLSLDRLGNLLVPQPDEALSTALEDLVSASERLAAWRTDAEALLQSVFLDENAAQARARIVSGGRTLLQRVEAGSLLDDLAYVVRTRFPYPIAYRWRRVEAEIGAEDVSHAHVAILDAAEIICCYAALLALALAREEGIMLPAAEALRQKLATQQGGPTFGDWTAILKQINRRRLRELPAEHPLSDLASLLADQDADAARQRLSKRRNRSAHLRRVDGVDLPDATKKDLSDLLTLAEKAQFLADWPLIQITSTRWDTLRGEATVSYRQLMGDHALVPIRTMTSQRNDLEQGSLYIVDSGRKMHLLRPFLIARECTVCKNLSIFHFDLDAGEFVLKSLEHGHVVADNSLAEVLRRVSLL